MKDKPHPASPAGEEFFGIKSKPNILNLDNKLKICYD
jgi:hypothetical protein